MQLNPKPNSVAQTFTYSLVGNSVLTLHSAAGPAGSPPVVQVLKQRVINAPAK